ncbi:MAG: nuclear transport factor 2 family protein [Trebonia sp.]
MTKTADTIERYMAVWNEPNPDARRAAVASVWTADGTEFVEGKQYRGHEELTERVGRAYETFVASGKYDITFADDLARHGDMVTFTVQLTAPSGEIDWSARVFLLISPDNLVKEDYHLTVKPLPPA